MNESRETKPLAAQLGDGDLSQVLVKLISVMDLLQQSIKEMSTPQLPIEHRLWNLDQVANYLNRSKSAANQIILIRGFPEPIQLPSTGKSDRSHKQWEASAIIGWAKRQKPSNTTRLGRPRLR